MIFYGAAQALPMPQRILVVEDHERYRRFLCASLARRAETEIFEAADGRTAIEKAEALQPDVILLDLGLPGLGGLDVARHLPRAAPRSTVLVVSSERDPDIIREALQAGAGGYLHKLRCDGELMPAIDAVLEGRRFVSSLLASRHHDRHEVLFYSEDRVLIEGFGRSVKATLETGGAAIVLATESHRNNLVRALRDAGVDIDREIERRRCVLLDAAEALDMIMVDGVPDRVRFLDALRHLIEVASTASHDEDPRVTICGECVGLLCANGDLPAALALEHTGRDLVRSLNVDILCAYPLSRCPIDEDGFSHVCAQHSAVRCV
jgi:CheY-like chemotaxis protein